MRKNFSKLSAITLCAMFASVQIAAASIDTGLGQGLGGAVINTTTGGYTGMTTGTNSATLNFNNNAHVNWNTLNVNSGETLNFNAVNGANGLTVLNTVNSGLTQVYGNINANSGISNLIISNPNGMLFDGAHVTTAGDLMLTTQPMSATFNGGNMTVTGLTDAATQGIVIRNNSDIRSTGGTFNLVAPSIDVVESALGGATGVKFTTANGQDYLVNPTLGQNINHSAVRLQSVEIDGNVYIASDKDIVKIVEGGTINGDLNVQSEGTVALNFANKLVRDDNGNVVNGVYDKENGEALTVTGNVDVTNAGRYTYLRDASVGGNLSMANSGGSVEIRDVNVTGNADLTTTNAVNTDRKHFVHVIGDTTVGGNLNIDSIHNIHIGGYERELHQFLDGNLHVNGDLNALAREGSVAVTIDTQADKINLESGTLNIMTDGVAQLTANEYQFKANRYIGGVSMDEPEETYTTRNLDTGALEQVTSPKLIHAMENYVPLPNVTKMSYIKVNPAVNALGHNAAHITKLETNTDGAVSSYARVQSNGDMHISGIKSDFVTLSAPNSNIQIDGPCPPQGNYTGDSTATLISISPDTKSVRVPFASRDYDLRFKNIKDNAVTDINGTTPITYDLTDNAGGNNDGTQIAGANTYLVGPGAPIVPPGPGPEPEPVVPTPTPVPDLQDNDNVKVLNNLGQDQIAKAIAADPAAAAPIAFAADLDDDIDTAIRKNVDGSVTIVRPFTPVK